MGRWARSCVDVSVLGLLYPKGMSYSGSRIEGVWFKTKSSLLENQSWYKKLSRRFKIANSCFLENGCCI